MLGEITPLNCQTRAYCKSAVAMQLYDALESDLSWFVHSNFKNMSNLVRR